jgi:hypothetical protein
MYTLDFRPRLAGRSMRTAALPGGWREVVQLIDVIRVGLLEEVRELLKCRVRADDGAVAAHDSVHVPQGQPFNHVAHDQRSVGQRGQDVTSRFLPVHKATVCTMLQP